MRKSKKLNKYLHQLYDESLNQKGMVEIANKSYRRSQILLKLDKEEYKTHFTKWNTERNQELIDHADEILKDDNNLRRFNTLIDSYKVNSLIPFIGAGMSMPSGYPSWTSFLYKLCSTTNIGLDQIDNIINNEGFEEAAQKLYNDLGAELFNEILEHTFSHSSKIVGAINYLPVLFKNVVLTTNFDNILERIYEGFRLPFRDKLSGAYLKDISGRMATSDRLLIKIHGDCRFSRDRVLTLNEYQDSYEKDDTLRIFFEKFLNNKSILFLGCSLSSDRTVKAMTSIVQNTEGQGLPKHFAFIEKPKKIESQKHKEKKLSKANIFPIWYMPERVEFQDENGSKSEKVNHDKAIESLLAKLISRI